MNGLRQGFIYLVAIIGWYSRYVLSWEISTILDKEFCMKALDRALESGKPEIFNTDQGVQFTSLEFTGRLEDAGIKISMDVEAGHWTIFCRTPVEKCKIRRGLL